MLPVTSKLPLMSTESLMVTTVLSSEEILFVTMLLAVSMPLILTRSLICIAEESELNNSLISKLLLILTVTSPFNTCEVIPLPPLILKVLPKYIGVPVESSPTNVIGDRLIFGSIQDLDPDVSLVST